METKYISVDGYSKIKSLKTANNRRNVKNNKSLSFSQKTCRFAKRLLIAGARFSVRKIKSLSTKPCTAEKHKGKPSTAVKSIIKNKTAKKPVSVIDKCYSENRKNNTVEFRATVKDAIGGISSRKVVKYEHSAPVSKRKQGKSVKKKASLSAIAGIVAVMLSCITAASALSVEQTNFSSQPSDCGRFISNNSKAELSLANDAITSGFFGLYIDSELIGVTAQPKNLDESLKQMLKDYRADYDENTTTEFVNDVQIKPISFDSKDIKAVEDIIKEAKSKLSIALSTDITYTKELECSVDVEYDDTQLTTYEKTKSEGKNGLEQVTYRTTFVDGVQTDAVITGTEVIEKPENKVVVKGTRESAVTGSFIWPIPYTHTISSYFEYRWGSFHKGLDIADSGIYGQEIVAADGGTVEFAGDDNSGYGNYVIINHNNGYKTVYGHCSSLAVSTGETVEQGQVIGYVGSTGFSTGPHLHFEIRQNDEAINPLDLVG